MQCSDFRQRLLVKGWICAGICHQLKETGFLIIFSPSGLSYLEINKANLSIRITMKIIRPIFYNENPESYIHQRVVRTPAMLNTLFSLNLGAGRPSICFAKKCNIRGPILMFQPPQKKIRTHRNGVSLLLNFLPKNEVARKLQYDSHML